MNNPRGYDPAPKVNPTQINTPQQNEKVPSGVPSVNEMGGEVKGRGQDPADPKK